MLHVMVYFSEKLFTVQSRKVTKTLHLLDNKTRKHSPRKIFQPRNRCGYLRKFHYTKNKTECESIKIFIGISKAAIQK